MRDAFVLDPIDPPDDGSPGLTLAELQLWAGCCPWCNFQAAFSPTEFFDGSIVCKVCGLEFVGTESDRSNEPPARTVTVVYAEGDVGLEQASAASLPEVTARE